MKKTPLSAFSNPRAGGIIAMGVEDDDAVITVQVTDGNGEIFIGTQKRHGDPLRRSATSGRWGGPPTACAASRCGTTTTSWRWRS